jgi:hypothetical protein
MVAGDAITTDDNKCQLKPLRRANYGVTFTDAEWAVMQATFPNGVCDFSKPGVSQQATIPWLTYQDAAGRVVYGGRPMGVAPASVAVDRCQMSRSASIRLRRGVGAVSARVYLNGKRVRTLRRVPAVLRLRGLPRGTVRVRVTVRVRGGRSLVTRRRLTICPG